MKKKTIDRALVVANGNRTNASGFISNITLSLSKMGVACDSVTLDNYNVQKMPHDYDIVISLGGDGTLLKTVHDFNFLGVPFFGINNGHLGFITPYTKTDWKLGLKAYVNGERFISKRIILDIVQKRKGRKILSEKAINEIYLHRPDARAVIRIKASVNGENFAGPLSADGIIVSTPTGSTAYSMSAGASILASDMHAFTFMPNNPFMSMDRGLVLAGDSKLILGLEEQQKTNEGIIDLDGHYLNNFKTSDTLEIRIANEQFQLITNPYLSEFERIGEKLQWRNDETKEKNECRANCKIHKIQDCKHL